MAGELRDFGYVLKMMREGKVMQRAGWNGSGKCIRTTLHPDGHADIVIENEGNGQPLFPQSEDLLALDWEVVPVAKAGEPALTEAQVAAMP